MRCLLIAFLLALSPSMLTAQCEARIDDFFIGQVNDHPAHLRIPAGVHIPEGFFVRYSRSLNDSTRLLIYSRTEDEFTIDYGIVLLIHGKQPKVIPLRSLKSLNGEIKPNGQDDELSFEAMARATSCTDRGPVYFITFHWLGDMTSPQLIVLLTPSQNGYFVSSLPTLSGGVLQISKTGPLKMRTWDNLNEGECNACKTHYKVCDYVLGTSQPMRTSCFIPRKLYTSGYWLFEERGIRFFPQSQP